MELCQANFAEAACNSKHAKFNKRILKLSVSEKAGAFWACNAIRVH